MSRYSSPWIRMPTEQLIELMRSVKGTTGLPEETRFMIEEAAERLESGLRFERATEHCVEWSMLQKIISYMYQEGNEMSETITYSTKPEDAREDQIKEEAKGTAIACESTETVMKRKFYGYARELQGMAARLYGMCKAAQLIAEEAEGEIKAIQDLGFELEELGR